MHVERLRQMATNPTLFAKITDLGSSAVVFGRRVPKWQPTVKECATWLEREGLTRKACSYLPDASRDPGELLTSPSPVTLGIPTRRAERRRKADLDDLKRHFWESSEAMPPKESLDQGAREDDPEA